MKKAAWVVSLIVMAALGLIGVYAVFEMTMSNTLGLELLPLVLMTFFFVPTFLLLLNRVRKASKSNQYTLDHILMENESEDDGSGPGVGLHLASFLYGLSTLIFSAILLYYILDQELGPMPNYSALAILIFLISLITITAITTMVTGAAGLRGQ